MLSCSKPWFGVTRSVPSAERPATTSPLHSLLQLVRLTLKHRKISHHHLTRKPNESHAATTLRGTIPTWPRWILRSIFPILYSIQYTPMISAARFCLFEETEDLNQTNEAVSHARPVPLSLALLEAERRPSCSGFTTMHLGTGFCPKYPGRGRHRLSARCFAPGWFSFNSFFWLKCDK